jgi:hypothetical protein
VNGLQDNVSSRHLANSGAQTTAIEIVGETPRVASNHKLRTAVRHPKVGILAATISRGNKSAVAIVINLKVVTKATDVLIAISRPKNRIPV